MDLDEIDWDRVRQALGRAVQRSSRRRVAHEIGIAHPTVTRILEGGVPEGAAREKVLRYIESVPERAEPDSSGMFHMERSRRRAHADPSDPQFLAGAYEATLWMSERVTGELKAVLRDARLQMRAGHWDPPDREQLQASPPVLRGRPKRVAELPPTADRKAVEEVIDRAIAENAPPLPDEAQRREDQLKRLEAVLAELEDEAGLSEPATIRSTLTLEERVQVLGRALALLRGESPQEESPPGEPEAEIREAQ